jgi:hypothetical protein
MEVYFYLPAFFMDVGDGFGRQFKIISYEYEVFICIRVAVKYAALTVPTFFSASALDARVVSQASSFDLMSSDLLMVEPAYEQEFSLAVPRSLAESVWPERHMSIISVK